MGYIRRMANAKPCTIVLRLRDTRGHLVREWTLTHDGVPLRFRSRAHAKRMLWLAADDVDALTSWSYEVGIRDAARTTWRSSAADFVVGLAKHEAWVNSIGARLGRGEAVAV
jgi:hypothetical protein